MCHMSHFRQGPQVSSLPGFPCQASATEDFPPNPPLAAPAPQNSVTAKPLPEMLFPLGARLCSSCMLEAA